jgi:transcriptional regulator with XRE-family HTH domain
VSVAERFGANLVHHRLAADLSQEDLSFRASLHRTEIGLLERGVRVPRIDTLAKLAGALGVAPADLLAGIAWEPGDVRLGRFTSS